MRIAYYGIFILHRFRLPWQPTSSFLPNLKTPNRTARPLANSAENLNICAFGLRIFKLNARKIQYFVTTCKSIIKGKRQQKWIGLSETVTSSS